MKNDMTELAEREVALGDGTTEVDEIAAELSLDNLTGLMCEPAGPLKRGTRGLGRSPSGPVDTGSGPADAERG